MTHSPNGRHLIIFVKAPIVGRAKTRLGKAIGPARAARFARRMAAWTVRTLSRDRRWRTTLAVTPDEYAHTGRWWPSNVSRVGQGPGDLGVRMGRPLIALPPGPVVIVGSDIPGLKPALVQSAFRLLGRHDAVFGPAADGGYWLVGFARRRPVGNPFRKVRWSGPHALGDTLGNLRSGLRVAYLPELNDVDTADDLACADLPVTSL